MKIAFLYAEMVPSWIPTLKCLIRNHDISVDFVHWDANGVKTPYKPPKIDGVTFHRRSQFSTQGLQTFLAQTSPSAIVISGWMDPGYLRAVVPSRRTGIPVIACFDDWWTGSMRQRLGAIAFPYYLWRYFSHAWVAGARQYEFARRLGFQDSSILHHLLTCDTDLFRSFAKPREAKERYFLYVGRYSAEKGISTLSSAYRTGVRSGTKLICIGNGPLQPTLIECGAEVYGFKTQAEIAELMSKALAVVVPSDRDFSPLVVHEATSAGAPIIASTMVGNASSFVIDGWNGLIFPARKPEALSAAMLHVSKWSEGELAAASERSLMLSHKVSPAITAATLASVARRTQSQL